jgi:hypothetical protein
MYPTFLNTYSNFCRAGLSYLWFSESSLPFDPISSLGMDGERLAAPPSEIEITETHSATTDVTCRPNFFIAHQHLNGLTYYGM